jgi:DNA-binding response OmpR family regulator
MSLKALLFTRDRQVALSFTKAIVELPMNWILLDDDQLPFELISHESFDLLVIDCTSSLGQAILQVARQSAANHKSVILAISEAAEIPKLLEFGANEYLERSTKDGVLAQRIRELVPLMNGEQRDHRCSLSHGTCIEPDRGESSTTALQMSNSAIRKQ